MRPPISDEFMRILQRPIGRLEPRIDWPIGTRVIIDYWTCEILGYSPSGSHVRVRSIDTDAEFWTSPQGIQEVLSVGEAVGIAPFEMPKV